MLLGSFELLLYDPASFVRLTVLVIFALLTAITVHEFSHSLIATVLGDGTSRSLGRLSLNPIRHLDPSGAVMMLVVGFGWGKPVPVNHHLLRGPWGMTLVAAAGPLSNLALAFLVAIPVKLGLLGWSAPGLYRATHVLSGGMREALTDIAGVVIFFNVLLAVFNLIPIYPLDGSRVLGGLLPDSMADSYAKFERFGPLLLLGIILADYVLRLGLLWKVIGPVVTALISLATGF
ncbi:MAG: site-2 protease family protein [Chloroflexota bacterium]|nr:site-2 protease family protein [Chloroflexota bacterium]